MSSNSEAWQSYKTELEILEDLRKEWYKHLILTSSSLFAILISLRPLATDVKSSSNLFYLLALTLLGLGIISFSVTLYGQIHTSTKAIELFVTEIHNAFLEHRNAFPQFYPTLKVFKITEYFGYFCFGSTIILLIVYLWLRY